MPFDLQQFRDAAGREAFGMTREEALAQGVCISCKRPPTFSTEAGRREYALSAICEPCFDGTFPDDEDDVA